jgi:hypothetical protein
MGLPRSTFYDAATKRTEDTEIIVRKQPAGAADTRA